MNRSLFRLTAYLQLGIVILTATGCAPTQPFFLNESPELKHYLDTATAIEYPDVDVESLPETTQSLEPLSIGNHDYQFWDVSLEECVSIALNNSKFLITTGGIAESRQNVADQFVSGTPEQFNSVYDVAIQQSTTQTVPLVVDGNGNRVLPRGAIRSNQVGGVEDALSEFDAQASSFISGDTTDRPQNTQVAVATQTVSTTSQSAISKRFATGGVATLRHQLSYNRSKTPLNQTLRVLPSDWTASIEAQVQHPLMRNRGTLVNRIPVVLASLNEDISITEFEVSVRNLVRDVENAYWDLYVAYRNVSSAVIARNSAIVTAQVAKYQLENGTGTQQELSQAVGQYYLFRGQLESALAGSNLPGSDRFGVYGAERRLRELLGQPPTDGRLIRPIDEPTLARVEYDWNDSVAQTLYLSPELRRTKIALKQNELELISAKNQILPDVNLSLLYRQVGLGDTLGPPSGNPGREYPQTGSSALRSLTSGDFQEGSVRLEITPPAWGARRENARIRNAELRLTRQKAFLQEQERLLVSRLSGAVAGVATHYQLVQTIAQRWQAAEVEVGARLAEYKGGQGQIVFVLQSQERRASAQIDYYRALGEYNKLLNYVDYLKGTLLANSNIALEEGPWAEKAYWDALERARERSAGKHLQYGVTRPGVVRQGPVRDAESASEMFGEGTSTFGETLPPGSQPPGSQPEAADPDGPTPAEPLDLNMTPHRQPVEVPERSLLELGSSTGELLQLGPTPDSLTPDTQSWDPSGSAANRASRPVAERPSWDNGSQPVGSGVTPNPRPEVSRAGYKASR